MSEDRSRVVVRLPTLGESISEGVINFLHPPGTMVARDQPIAELELDKCSIELVAPEAGVIEAQLVGHGDVVTIGAELYVLRRLDAQVLLAPDGTATLRCDLEHLLARAAGLGEPRVAEAALFLTAIVRAFAAVPYLLPRGPAVTTLWVDRDEVGERRVCAAIPVDIEVAGALQAMATDTPDLPAQLQVLRLHGRAAPTERPADASALRVVIGAVAHEPVARAGAIVVRPMTTIIVARDRGGEALRSFAAVLAEQLGQV